MNGTPRGGLGCVVSDPFEPGIDVGSCYPSGHKGQRDLPFGRIKARALAVMAVDVAARPASASSERQGHWR